MASFTQNQMTEKFIDELLLEFRKHAPAKPKKGDGFGSMHLKTSNSGDEIICWIEDWDTHDTLGYGSVNRKTKKYKEHYFSEAAAGA